MTRLATPDFWDCYRELPGHIRKLADEKFQLLKTDPRHPSLHFKKVGSVWSARVNIDYRALADEENGEFTWFWIGPHDEYDRLITTDWKLDQLRMDCIDVPSCNEVTKGKSGAKGIRQFGMGIQLMSSTSDRTPAPRRPAASRL